MKYWKLTLVAAAVAFAVPFVFVSAPALKIVDGWNIKGMQEGQDIVTTQAVANGLPMLHIEKKSAYQPGKFLYVFKNFSGVAWRARRIRMQYEIEAKGSFNATESEPVLVRISMQCGQYSDSTLETLQTLEGKRSRSLYFKVPKDATACSFGFTTGIVSSLLVKSIRFEEADSTPPADDLLFPLPKAGTPVPMLETAQ